MFNSSSANNVDVRVILSDGNAVEGAIAGGVTTNLATVLNRPGNFLEIIQSNGSKKYISMAQVVSVEAAKSLEKPHSPSTRSANSETAYDILGLQHGCDTAALRSQYHKMVKLYHPDKYLSVDLPPEVAAYIRSTFEQLSRAHEIVEAQLKADRAA